MPKRKHCGDIYPAFDKSKKEKEVKLGYEETSESTLKHIVCEKTEICRVQNTVVHKQQSHKALHQ